MAGELWKSKWHAKTLEAIAKSEGRDFYEGELADKIDDFLKKYQGKLKKKDLEQYKVRWETPVSVSYRGYDVWEIPPNGQGMIALQALAIIQGMELKPVENEETVHQIIEALKLAFVDGKAHIADPDHMERSVGDMLSEEYIQSRRKLIAWDLDRE